MGKPLNEPDPFQPTDTDDEMVEIILGLKGMWIERVQFECSQCHERYYRSITMEEHFTEIVEMQDFILPNGKPARYAINPKVVSVWEPLPHVHDGRTDRQG